MDRTCSPTTPKSLLILPMHLRLEASEMPIPAGLTPPSSFSLFPSSLSLPLTPAPAPDGQVLSEKWPGRLCWGRVRSWIISSRGAGYQGKGRWSSVLMRNHSRALFRGLRRECKR